ncbi:hypothetical protein L249_7373 [Ophiocordyceps polyrhachis-furcata BCC 54312]|uniref:SUN domain-containing protein n=1 Tax=Ophiocordyceps polyrhachis-furcata BCC 54312 TaxID=1330021 RepID=A0A367LB89_9HYPO|nr:hypothetical protein L249_7373 [Ophiocordyceps polyrhachis-furcata BCC 54312]
MKILISYALVTALAVSVHARSHHHHLHHHARKNVAASLVQRADSHPAVEESPVETVYQDMGGRTMKNDEAEKCLQSKHCVIVHESTPQKPPPPPASTPPKPASSPQAPDVGAKFIEKPSAYKAPPPPPALNHLATNVKSAQPNKLGSKSGSDDSKTEHDYSSPGSTGLSRHFPSGTVECSRFPSEYGAVPLEWHDMGGWCGVQHVPGFSLRLATAIGQIATGKKCSPGSMCSYACPPGYQKTQWPAVQGSNHESVGGLFCNKDGFLELTRPESKTLCEKGVGGVVVKNKISEQVTLCRTDYPGTENMAIPTVANPGAQVELTNPDQTSYYQWAGKPTSAQYYVNLAGLGPEDACVWKNTKTTLSGKTGNWAPLNIGSGFDGTNTYISLFPNLPTSDCALDFDVSIEGDVLGGCSYTRFTTGSEMKRCTATLKPGGKAVIVFS